MSNTVPVKERYQLIDALRGLSILLMMAYHFLAAMMYFGLSGDRLFYSPTLQVLQPLFAAIFILLSGISCHFSRNNLKRGLLTIGCAAVITVVSIFFGLNIWFGILHFLGLCMVLYGLLGKWIAKIPRKIALVCWIVLSVIGFVVFPIDMNTPWLLWLGLRPPTMIMFDYFPLCKWFFVFLIGTWLGTPIKAHQFPAWFYKFNMPLLPAIGRKTLLLYMIHQPIFFGILTVYQFFNNK